MKNVSEEQIKQLKEMKEIWDEKTSNSKDGFTSMMTNVISSCLDLTIDNIKTYLKHKNNV